MSINWQTDAEPRAGILVLPPAVASLDEAHAAIELWEHYSKKRLDPTQRLVVEVMMAQRADGDWAASTTGREMPRQNGKGDEVEVVELWGLVQRSEAILHTIHDAVLLATQTQSRMLGVLEGHPDLRRLVKRRWLGTGQQMIEMRNGGIIWYRTRTGGGGRGVDDIDRLIVDEAQHAAPEHLAAITPILLANSNPQMNVLGTSGLEGTSGWWWSVRRRALSADPGRFGYVGHTVERPCLMGDAVVSDAVDPLDRSLWPTANPVLMSGRGTGLEFFEEQLHRLGPKSFAREHLGVWDPEPSSTGAVIGSDVWDALKDADSVVASHRMWSVSVSPDRQWTSFASAGRRADGRLHVDTTKRAPGTSWAVDFAVEVFTGSRLPLRVHKSGPESSFVGLLRERGVEVVEVSSAEVAAATGQFVDFANADRLRHLGQASLGIALKGAVLRTSVDGAALWSQRNSSVEITALMACTVAAGGVPALAEHSSVMVGGLADFLSDEE